MDPIVIPSAWQQADPPFLPGLDSRPNAKPYPQELFLHFCADSTGQRVLTRRLVFVFLNTSWMSQMANLLGKSHFTTLTWDHMTV